MINQPEPVYSYTIPYYTSSQGDTDEVFVSEKTYAKYLEALKKEQLFIIFGALHPISKEYGDVTTTLVDKEKTIIIIGITDLEEFTSELLDIAIAQELEKVLLMDKEQFIRFLYKEDVEDTIKIFVDDMQQTLEEIHISKRLKKEGYRISEREHLVATDIFENAVQWSSLRTVSPYENEHALFLLTKLYYLAHIDEELLRQYKNHFHKHYPRLLREAENLLHLTKKLNISTQKGREKALTKIFTKLNYLQHVRKMSINELSPFSLAIRH
ncbi:hypothetical protein DS745_20115 [Anaerobacillus alkaliphilus]|uniref:Uncharacterized protein n=1 Tax=Anaerobacillus alkaliphilus TaxID=1548597 RepID=A0A4Q0VQB9_9BACI|nr:hypothetical protein [Anaerobacillus alkaliphilus]RXI98623.1 hypothetical protein DS745_20115 [Anaerobacillus alkaliphilus]